MRNARAWASRTDRWPDADFRDMALAFYDASFAVAYRILAISLRACSYRRTFFAERHPRRERDAALRDTIPRIYPRGPSRSSAPALIRTDGSITHAVPVTTWAAFELQSADGTWAARPTGRKR